MVSFLKCLSLELGKSLEGSLNHFMEIFITREDIGEVFSIGKEGVFRLKTLRNFFFGYFKFLQDNGKAQPDVSKLLFILL